MERKKYVLVIFVLLLLFYLGGILIPLVRGSPPDSGTYAGIFLVVILAIGVTYILKSKRWSRV